MSLEVGEVAASFVDRVSDLPLARGLLRSPPLTALLLTALVAVILMASYAPAVRASGARRAVRTALYFFFGALFILFAHHSLLTRSARAEAANLSAREVHAGVAQALAWSDPSWAAEPGPAEGPATAPAAGQAGALAPAPGGPSQAAGPAPPGPAGAQPGPAGAAPAGPPRRRPDNVAPFAPGA
jgi:hypothetical protein